MSLPTVTKGALAGVVTDADSVTPLVLAAMAATPNARLGQIVTALVEHLHAFVRETRPSDEEFEQGLAFLAAIGQATGPKKNEAVLLSDILGVSTLVSVLNHQQASAATDAALLGPFWRRDAPRCALGDNIARGDTPGVPLAVSGRVLDLQGRPVANAAVDVWQASPTGFYENQDASQQPMNLRGLFHTDADGCYRFRTVRPAGYPVPTDGPCGDLLRAQRRHPYRPAHVHFMVSAPDYATLVTQVFADDAEHLTTDVVFAVLAPLIGNFSETVDGSGNRCATLVYDFVLQPGVQTFPAPPIP